MKIISIVTVAQLFSWGIFLLGDYLSETFSNDLLLMTALLFLPVMIPIAYLIFQKRIHYGSIPTWVNTLTVLFVWVMEAVVFSCVISALHPVPQSPGMLNGIEYILFLYFNIIAPLFIVAAWNLILFVYRILKGL